MSALLTTYASGLLGTDLLTACLAVLVAAGLALWAIRKYVEERRAGRRQEARLAGRELQQRRDEALILRQQRAAELIRAVGDASNPQARRWALSALSMYPEQALDLLLTSLGEAAAQDVSAIKLAVVSLGPDAIPRTVHHHQVARQICAIGDEARAASGESPGGRPVDVQAAARVRDLTREILVHLLLQLDDDGRREADLGGVDLSAVNLAATRLRQVCLRRSTLDGAVFTRAGMRGANLRRASVERTVFTGATLAGADLTGARGTIRAEQADLAEAVLDQAKLAGSALDEARLQHASLASTVLDRASLAGAALTSAHLYRTRLVQASAHHVLANELVATGADLSNADLREAWLAGATFERSKLARVSAQRAEAPGARFLGVNLSRADLSGADLTGAELEGCVMGGTTMDFATLVDASLVTCTIASTSLVGALLEDTEFVGCTFKGRVDLTGTDLTGVAIRGCHFEEGTDLVVDNDSWRDADLDESALEEFSRAEEPVE
jgi:uncharacterized protein YjbI with pentapeptide repeats